MIGMVAIVLGLIWAWLCASTVMAIAFVIYIRTKRPISVDMFWGASVTTAVWGIMQLSGAVFPIAILITIWGARLSVYLYWTRWRRRHRDPRYQALEEKWGQHGLMGRYYLFYQVQAIVVAVLLLPLIIRVGIGPSSVSIWDTVGGIVFIVGLAGEIIADHQLLAYKANHKGVCREGLWAYSRHPNYFFEWLIWLGVGLTAFASGSWGFLGLLSPLIMYGTLVHGTGIPHAEAQSLRRHGEAYRQYQATVPAFFLKFWKR
jgi:steroid 5-alpha reductase family enzyme